MGAQYFAMGLLFSSTGQACDTLHRLIHPVARREVSRGRLVGVVGLERRLGRALLLLLGFVHDYLGLGRYRAPPRIRISTSYTPSARSSPRARTTEFIKSATRPVSR